MPPVGLCAMQKELGGGGVALERVARTGLFEEVTYPDLKVPVWRGFTHWMGLD